MHTCDFFLLHLRNLYNLKNSSLKAQIYQSFTVFGLCPKGIGGTANTPKALTSI